MPSKKITLNILAAIIILSILWVVSSLGQLRTFIPDYFRLVGTLFSDRTYLILFQNNNELRPTGGFISAYGVLDISHGFPSGLNFYDVYGEIDEHEYIDPPYYPMQELLWSETYGGYTFRDANYFIDFEDSATELIKFYQITNPEAQIDGIIAVDFSTLEDLVGLYEPIEAGEFSLTKNNLFETLEAEVSDIDRHNEEEISGRKNIMKDIIKELVQKIIASPLSIRKLSDTIVQSLNEKHIILWFEDEFMAHKITTLGWSATMPYTQGDLLAINESNLGGMKGDRYISRNIKYEVTIGEDSVTSTLTIAIDHFGGNNIPLSGDYKGYFRAFVPSGATLISESDETHTELYDDYQAFGDIVRLGYGQNTTLTYTYSLPISVVADGVYSLHLVKQPGTEADHYEIIVHTPQGSTLESDSFETKEEHAYLSVDLTQDKIFSIKINPDETAPRIHSHEIVELNKIYIGFNEPLDCATASDPFAYSILDTDKTVSGQTDSVYIDTITCDGSNVWLDTIGMTSQDEEFYEITLRNIRDKHGNYIDPNPRTITVVQRGL
ncbi:hypothetical protein A2344_02940 [Candidatus Peregrinibacteria bacterium RIFOXYB12_FULL_41_12]|nr:MAG: hypothetical protein A2244_02540 [Candidatus Peregrinibacteria bacterium RIFOXYA2_FULL_41_18]OGJ48878.1 MAG: hypothetical protein A2344_02940 [Candidatus Peregrinibacteria bacterium RIFOXYB12_FULL_41_12]OGJ52683.1 MAG: hypothetical protein A2448_03110 [Candidatus Peregrinibacteria bacterium RIFOXYC2_FULL_41_22]